MLEEQKETQERAFGGDEDLAVESDSDKFGCALSNLYWEFVTTSIKMQTFSKRNCII